MKASIDVREVTLRAVYPEGIPIEEYGKAIRLIADLTVMGLAGHPALREARASKVGRSAKGGGKTITASVFEALAKEPRTTGELVEILGHPANLLGSTLTHLKSERGGRRLKRSASGKWSLRGKP